MTSRVLTDRTTGVLTRRDALIVGADSEMTAPRVMEAVVDKAAGAVEYRAASIDQARQHERHSSNSKVVLAAAVMRTKVSILAPQLISTAGFVGNGAIFGRFVAPQHHACSDGRRLLRECSATAHKIKFGRV